MSTSSSDGGVSSGKARASMRVYAPLRRLPTMTPTLRGMGRTPGHVQKIVERLVVGARVVEVREMPRAGNDGELRMRQRACQLSARIDACFRVVLAIHD